MIIPEASPSRLYIYGTPLPQGRTVLTQKMFELVFPQKFINRGFFLVKLINASRF